MIMRRMSLFASSLWWPRLAAWVLSALVAASAVAWGLRIGADRGAEVSAPAVAIALAPDSTAVARAFGEHVAEIVPSGATTVPVRALESSRFVLLGVLQQGSAQGTASGVSDGAALVAVDGKPAKPVTVGATLVDGWTLESVAGRSAVLARQGSRIALELPALPPLIGFQVKSKTSP
jgi:general secretion pathway protein C